MLAFHAAHSIHTPLEVMPKYDHYFDFIDNDHRRLYHAMVYSVDQAVGDIVNALKSKGTPFFNSKKIQYL